MLPDLCGMANLRLEELYDPRLDAGARFHHLCDDIFHKHPLFIELAEAARDRLQAQAMPRGAAAAIGHVGVELLMDGALVTSGEILADYRAAIDEFARISGEIKFHGLDPDESGNRSRHLASHLVSAPIPLGYVDPTFVAKRLIRILASRPVLAIPGDREDLVYQWTADSAPEIFEVTSRLIDEVDEYANALSEW